jgi:hypothetical protein
MGVLIAAVIIILMVPIYGAFAHNPAETFYVLFILAAGIPLAIGLYKNRHRRVVRVGLTAVAVIGFLVISVIGARSYTDARNEAEWKQTLATHNDLIDRALQKAGLPLTYTDTTFGLVENYNSQIWRLSPHAGRLFAPAFFAVGSDRLANIVKHTEPLDTAATICEIAIFSDYQTHLAGMPNYYDVLQRLFHGKAKDAIVDIDAEIGRMPHPDVARACKAYLLEEG